jgi:hypothetical protein
MSLGSMLRALALASLVLGAVANEATHRVRFIAIRNAFAPPCFVTQIAMSF